MAHSTIRHELEQKQTIFVAQPETHQVIRVKNVLDQRHSTPADINVEDNWEPFIGNGDRCLPGDLNSCGDGGPAKNAKLAYPKGKQVACHIRIII